MLTFKMSLEKVYLKIKEKVQGFSEYVSTSGERDDEQIRRKIKKGVEVYNV